MHRLLKKFFWFISDIIAVTKRNLIRYRRLPQLLVFATIQPVMFVLLFAYVFGGAIKIPGVSYLDYLLPGIFAQAVMFGAIQTGVGLADDLSRGMIDRFRSLPMARAAVLAGRTLADMVRNIFVVFLMSGVGALIGFRYHDGLLHFLAALLLAVFFGFAFSWVSATIGMAVKNPEAVQVAGFVWTFPLVFASSVFVPIEGMPSLLEAFARVSPITFTVNAIRALTLGEKIAGGISEPLLGSLLWIIGILVVFTPLAIWLYRRTE